jgi:hypothetical protein
MESIFSVHIYTVYLRLHLSTVLTRLYPDRYPDGPNLKIDMSRTKSPPVLEMPVAHWSGCRSLLIPVVL